MEINQAILSNLPIEIVLTIITKYTGHFRIENKGGKARLIQLLGEERKEDFKNIYETIPKRIIKINGIFSTNPFISINIILPSKDERHVKEYEKIEYYYINFGVGEPYELLGTAPGTVRKYHLISKTFDLRGTFPLDPWLSDVRSNAFLIKKNDKYFLPVLDSKNEERDLKAILCSELST